MGIYEKGKYIILFIMFLIFIPLFLTFYDNIKEYIGLVDKNITAVKSLKIMPFLDLNFIIPTFLIVIIILVILFFIFKIKNSEEYY